MASTRVAPLARWSVAVAVALMGAALIATAWTTRASARDARDKLLRGEQMAMEQAVRADLVDLDGPPDGADLAAVLDAHRSAGLRFLGVYGADGAVLASAGASSDDPSRVRVEVRASRRGFHRGERGARLVIELEPVESQALDAAATRAWLIGLAAAAVLMIVAAVLFRWMLRRERLEREREREKRLASLGELSAVLAHEIRNPLASLKGNAQLLAATLPAGDKPRQKAERVVDEAVRLEALTNDLLEYVRTGSIRRAPIDPTALLRDSAASVPGEITIEASGAPATWPLDEARLRQVLVNLLDNAIAAGPPVIARVSSSGGALVYEIIDHGAGVAPGETEKIFEPFFTRKARGTGLGLAVAKRVVEQHGGTITAGAAPGGGARFRVELPRA